MHIVEGMAEVIMAEVIEEVITADIMAVIMEEVIGVAAFGSEVRGGVRGGIIHLPIPIITRIRPL